MSKITVATVLITLTLLVHNGAFAQDRPPANASTPAQDEINKLKALAANQQKRIEQLERTVDDQRKLIEQALHVSVATRNGDQPATTVKLQPADVPENVSAQPPPAPIQNPSADGPLSIRLGKVSVTPYGFLDLTTIVRDKDIASGISTNFGSIPFSNTVTGQLSELRFTAQNTRLGMRFDAHHGGADFLGLFEPSSAHVHYLYVSLRYVLLGAPPAKADQ